MAPTPKQKKHRKPVLQNELASRWHTISFVLLEPMGLAKRARRYEVSGAHHTTLPQRHTDSEPASVLIMVAQHPTRAAVKALQSIRGLRSYVSPQMYRCLRALRMSTSCTETAYGRPSTNTNRQAPRLHQSSGAETEDHKSRLDDVPNLGINKTYTIMIQERASNGEKPLM